MKTKNEESCCSPSVAEPVEAAVRATKPKYKVRQEEDAWQVSVEAPGVKRNGVEVSFEDGILDVKARRTESVPESWRPLNYVPEARDYRLQLRITDAIVQRLVQREPAQRIGHRLTIDDDAEHKLVVLELDRIRRGPERVDRHLEDVHRCFFDGPPGPGLNLGRDLFQDGRSFHVDRRQPRTRALHLRGMRFDPR